MVASEKHLEEKRPLNEAKILLVGEGGVGKTSLAKRLLENTFDPHENRTEGIDIQSWQVNVQGQKVSLNVWDFGGQEIMHATHQFFLTKRSLYLLVLDARLDENSNRLEYWLKIVRSFGGNSPIIIVGNKTDQHPLDINRRGLRQKYPQIQAILETSCLTGQGIERLRKTIQENINRLDHIRDPLPTSWFQVKTALEQMQRDYIPYADYERLCEEKGIKKPSDRRLLAGFLHDLGTALHFQDDPRLADTNILNPEWVTHGVYKILNDKELIVECKGVLERSMLDRILDVQRYPRDKHLFVINMMRKFELCFDIEPDERFLIPDLLPKEEPYTGEWDDALAFEYHYNVLPGSIMSRFIVRSHYQVYKKTYWRCGVVLEYEGNLALVKADREDRKIFVRIKGKPIARRGFLGQIRDRFRYIHNTISGIQAQEKVALPNHPHILVDYRHLLNLEAMGETSFVPYGLQEKIEVRDLLNGFLSESDRHEQASLDKKNARVHRLVLPDNSNAQETQAFRSHIEKLRRDNPNWSIRLDYPRAGEAEAYVAIYKDKDENYAADQIQVAYLMSRSFSEIFERNDGDK